MYRVLAVRVNVRDEVSSLFLSIFMQALFMAFLIWDSFQTWIVLVPILAVMTKLW